MWAARLHKESEREIQYYTIQYKTWDEDGGNGRSNRINLDATYVSQQERCNACPQEETTNREREDKKRLQWIA